MQREECRIPEGKKGGNVGERETEQRGELCKDQWVEERSGSKYKPSEVENLGKSRVEQVGRSCCVVHSGLF